MKEIKRMVVLAALLAGLHPTSLITAAPGDEYWDETIGNPGIPPGTGAITSMALWKDNLVVGGYFSQIGGVQATNVAVWDGAVWRALGDGLGIYDEHRFLASYVEALRVIGGELYAAGYFTNSGPAALSNIAKWTGSGWVAIGSGLNSIVFDVAGRSSDDIYAGGHFTSADGRPVNKIAHWNGKEWLPLSSGAAMDGDLEPFVHAIEVTETSVYVGGRFTKIGKVGATNVATWTGSSWEPLGGGLGPPSQAVYSLAWSGGKLYAGGSFGHALGASVRGVAQWDASAWKPVGGLLAEEPPSYVVVLKALEDDVVIAGEFREVGGVPANNIARWTGEEWTALGSGLGSGPIVRALEATRSAIYAGGDFTMAGTVPSMNVAKWHIPRTLELKSQENELRISWPAADTNFILEASGGLPSATWSVVESAPALVQGRFTVTNEIGSGNQFFRLREKTMP